jgi:hypothetical protein
MRRRLRDRFERLTIAVMARRSQLYYWTRQWQRDEAEAVCELERGEGVSFSDPLDAVRWLRQ